MLKTWYKKILSKDYEQEKLIQLVQKFASAQTKVLDIGCGYGRYLIPLKQLGYDVLGVEQNSQIVEANKSKGLNCITVDAFKETTSKFDMLICSHIIEHFNPQDLFVFLDFYLSKLNPGGYIIFATPLYTDYFYDDFDHVKPYHPLGLQMVFGGNKAQVQYYSEHKLDLRDIWFRKSPYFSTFHRAKYITSLKTRMIQLYDLAMALLFRLTVGFMGRKDGWVGVFQKG